MNESFSVNSDLKTVPAIHCGAPNLETLALAPFDDGPRVRDLDIAERLGFDRPRDVRKLIERNLAEFQAMGVCAMVARTPGAQGGRPTSEYWLNEEQALLVATLSKASAASAVRAALIKTFVAWRRGQLTAPAFDPKVLGGIVKAVVGSQLDQRLPAIREDLITAVIESDPRVAAVLFKPALDVLIEQGVPPKRRRAFSQRVSSRLGRFSEDRGFLVRRSRETGRRLFHVDAITAWLEAEGKALIRDHMAAVSAQGVLKLVPRA